MDKIIVTLRDDKGAIKLRVSRETAERLKKEEYDTLIPMAIIK